MREEILRTIEAIIVLGGIGSLFYAVFKSGTTNTIIKSQKDLIETLTVQVDQLRTLHIENEKAIAELRGQVSVYKELPLSELAASMKTLSDTQLEILKLVKNNRKDQR